MVPINPHFFDFIRDHLFTLPVGPAQVTARLVEFTLLRSLSPMISARLATGAALLAMFGPVAAIPFVLLHGAGNGMLTIARGTLGRCAAAIRPGPRSSRATRRFAALGLAYGPVLPRTVRTRRSRTRHQGGRRHTSKNFRRQAASPGVIARDFDQTIRRLIPHGRCRDTLGQPSPFAGTDGQGQVPPEVLTGCRRAPRGTASGLPVGSRLAGRGGSGFQPAMTRATSRACRLSVIPGNRRRNSIAADNSPRCSNAVRIAAASASETTNISEAW